MVRYTWLLILCTLALPAHAGDPEARAWLVRMSRALANQNYDGRFFHLSEERSETLRIIHRVDRGKVTERLVSLDGSGREIVRNESEVICYLPDVRTVLVEKRTDNNPLLDALPSYSKGLEEHYSIEKVGGVVKALGRKTQMILVQPRDEYRYGYRLWLDQETAMPLKSQLCDRDGKVIEQILFAELNLRDRIGADELKPAVSGEGFKWLRQDVQQPSIPKAVLGWNVVHLPAGFRLTTWRIQIIAGSSAPVRHLVYSDGLASVSVFIEPRNGEVAQMRGLAKLGAAVAYSRDVEDQMVTVVGEVPIATVQAMAASVKRQDPVKSPALTAAPEAPQPATR